jgi:predicted NBD/HSP70 family sugar kinase
MMTPNSRVSGKIEQRELAILELIHSGSNCSRLELAHQSGLSPASITAIVRTLIQKSLVAESEVMSSPTGRKPISLEVRGDIGCLIGVDIGSFYTRVVVTNLNGKVIGRTQIETGIMDGRTAVLRRVFDCIYRALEDSEVSNQAILGIGIAHSGVIDSENGLVLSFPRPGQTTEWRNVPLRCLFEDEFKVPCLLEDSVRTMAVAERCFGLGRKVKDFVYVEVGMGIGAAFFLNGKLYRGAGGKAGEFGHITVNENGPLCSCGNNGCLETVASCAAIIRSVRLALEHGVDSKIRDHADRDLERVSVETITEAAIENDSLAYRVLQDAASYIAIGLADLVNLLNPKQIVFGGALFRAAPQLLSDPLRRIIRQRSLEKLANEVELKVSPLGAEAGALGAARLMAVEALRTLYLSR